MTEDRGRTFPEAAHRADTARSYPPRLRGRAGVGALMRDLCCYAVILRRRWMTRRFAGTGSFAKCNHERPDNSPT